MPIAIYRKYRPGTFSEVTGQKHVKRAVQNQVKNGTISHAYLFNGPRGVGKTTLARLIAKAVNCEDLQDSEPCNACNACEAILEGSALDIHEIDAASHTDVDNVRENIIKSVRFAPNNLKRKVYIIDEVHMLSTSAFNALLKTLEEPPEHAMFILATTEIHKVPETIISRCQRFDFRRIPHDELVERLNMLAKKEGVHVDAMVLDHVARLSEGCARDGESLLGQLLALGEEQISMDEAMLVLPATTAVQIVDFLACLFQDDTPGAIEKINAYVEQGVDMSQFSEDIVRTLRDMLMERLGQDDRLVEALGQELSDRLQSTVGQRSTDWIANAIETFLSSGRLVRSEQIPQLSAELAVVKLCGSSQPDTPVQTPQASTQAKSGKVTKQSKAKKKQPKETKKTQKKTQAPPPEPAQAKSIQEPTKMKVDTKETSTVPAPPIGSVDGGVSQTKKETATVQVKTKEGVTDAADVKETAAGGVPVIALNEVQDKWGEVFRQLKELNASLPLIFQSGEVQDVKGDHIEVAFEYSFHAETVNKEKNRQLVEKVFERVFGKSLHVRATYAHEENDETVASLINEFGGTVVS